MWNKFSIIWHGLSGHFRGYHVVESRYWLYLVGSVVSLTILLINASVSFNFYRFNVLTKAVGLSESSSFIGAILLTLILAVAAWILLSFLAYLFSAKLNHRPSALVGISKSDVFFSLLGVVFLAGLDVYANLHGVEEIVLSSTQTHQQDPTVDIDADFEEQRLATIVRLTKKRQTVEAEITMINQWTGKAHSCTKTACPTKKKGNGTIGAHWKGVLTAFGTGRLTELKQSLAELDQQEQGELQRIDQRKQTVATSLLGRYQKDVQRYHTELGEKNRTLKGFVLLAYPFSFVIEFLLAGITFLALEYLYETQRLERPEVIVYTNGSFRSSTKVEAYEKPVAKKSKAKKRTYEITCQNCGDPATKRHPRARFCSNECRIEWNENEKGYSVASIRKAKAGRAN